MTPQYAVPCVEDIVATLRDLLLVHNEDQLAMACVLRICLLIYLKGKITGRKGEMEQREIFHLLLHSPNSPTSGAGLSRSQEP